MNAQRSFIPRSALDEAFGAQTPVRGFEATATTLTERSDIGSLLLNCACEASAVVVELEAAAQREFPRECGRVTQQPPQAVLWLTPRAWLFQCTIESELQLRDSINNAFVDKRVHAAAFTDQLCWLELAGVEALRLLSSGGFVTLEPAGMQVGYAKRVLLAGLPVVALRVRTNAFLLAVERSRARYFCHWLQSAAARSILKE